MSYAARAWAFDLGDQVECMVTNHIGIVVSRSENLNDCERYWVQPTNDKDGKPRDGSWIDGQQLTLIEAGKFKYENRTGAGGPSSSRY